MELLKKQIHYTKEGKRIFDQFYLDEDINVPDAKNDIRKIIYGSAGAKVEEIRPVENYLCVTGKLNFQILYMTADQDSQAEVLEGKLPFEEMVYVQTDDRENYFIRNIRNEFTCSLVHSRKFEVRAMIEMEIGRERLEDEETTVDAKQEEDLYKKIKKVNLLELHTCKKDTYRIKEEIILPGTKESVGRLLITDVSARKFEIRISKGSLLLNGELLVFCMYKSEEGKTDWIEQTVPFEGRLECTDVSEDMYYSIQNVLEDTLIDIRLDEDGEMRVLGVEGTLVLRMNIYKEEEISLLEDMYSLKEKIELTSKEAEYEELLVQNHSKCKVSECLQLPELKSEVLQICHSEGGIQIERTLQTEKGLQLEGVLHLSFIYLKADDEMPFGSWQGMVPFSYRLECPVMKQEIHYNLSYHIEQLSVNPAGTEAVEVKAVLGFDIFLRKSVPMQVITEADTAEYSLEKMEKRPGIVGYMVKEGDELWNLAKTYMTTAERIKEVNALESETIKAGDKLLIFKECKMVI